MIYGGDDPMIPQEAVDGLADGIRSKSDASIAFEAKVRAVECRGVPRG